MPVKDSPYCPVFPFGNGHIQTIYPVLFRKIPSLVYTRERITTADDDFLDLDWSTPGNNRLAIVSHGLEGNSTRTYVKAMVQALNHGGWDALAWNYRSCSGEPNRQLRSYHNGATDDLARVIDHARKKGKYKEIALVGFSLGGNLTLVHLGRDRVDPIVKKAVVFSVPCDLAASAEALEKPSNRLYMKRFLVLLHRKIKEKMAIMPHALDDKGYDRIKTFRQFDDRYTAPIHGFKDARDYWEKCSSLQFIPKIDRPCLIINALNDPFLPQECFPIAQAGQNPNITLKLPKSGGHVGFVSFKGRYWSEDQAVWFLNRPG
ncbi:MAG: alpha/beta fold hydrolase [Proteobacteria bacterium]|nr:alpha/beta fold hydrolase [Desulfobacula sp.]MBU3951697.1 alpha/beta fold hydrolase [Pseudomonadota bacterium]MBU4132373.1 alpha/beta fold hydrolase [Pseudomonadota bacterium]